MNNFLKILIGVGAAAATAGIVLALAKKKEEPDFECDFECDDCDVEDCDCLDCECADCDEEDCEDCEFCLEDDEVRPSAMDVLNSVVDGVMGGFVVAADKTSELLNKAADYVSAKLEERHSACDCAEFKICDCDDFEDECDCCVDACDCEDECDDECECGCCCECEAPVEVESAEEIPAEEAPVEE